MPSGKSIVTTVIRAYNRRHRIMDAIESALSQTLSDQPIIVVDDASNDGTAEAIRQKFGTRITVISHEENLGPGAAANTGLDAAQTPFTAFLDSDDRWHPSFLEKMVSAFEATPGATMAYSDLRRSFSAFNLDRAAESHPPETIIENLAGPAITMSVVVVRTRSAKRIGGFTTDHRVGEDFDFYVRMWLNAPHSLIHVREPLAVYDYWSGNVTKETNAFLEHVFHHIDKFLKEPAFAHLAEKRAQILSGRSFGIAANREVDKWLSAPPTRSFCIIISGVEDETALIETLRSIAAQRLPPRDVVVLHEAPLSSPEIVAPAWPFLLQTFPQNPNDTKARILRNVLSMTTSSLVLYLQAGDTLAATALDDHRRAFSSSFRTIAFSYGGTPKRPEPAALPLHVAPLSMAAFQDDTPGVLSAMAMSRKALLKTGGIPDVGDDALWYALACQLTAPKRPAVRIRHPVLTHCEEKPVDWQTKADTLARFAATDAGRTCQGVVDQLMDAAENA